MLALFAPSATIVVVGTDSMLSRAPSVGAAGSFRLESPVMTSPSTDAVTSFDVSTSDTVNVPLAAGCGDGELEAVFRQILVPIADAQRPDLVLVSAGFDAHRDDPLGGMRMTEDGFVTLLGIAREIADRHANGHLALVLEGGYDLGALSRSVLACVRGLIGDPGSPSVTSATMDLGPVIAEQRKFWPL